jgi:hypothetical protein
MKSFRSPRHFAAVVCKEAGQRRPKETWYEVVHPRHGTIRQTKAPRSYRGLEQVTFFVDGKRSVKRICGFWVETARGVNLRELEQWRADDEVAKVRRFKLCDVVLRVSRTVGPELRDTLHGYLRGGGTSLREEFIGNLLSEVRDIMGDD